MSKKEYLEYKKSYMLVPLSITFLLVIGIVVSLVQVRQQQTIQSKASEPASSASSVDCTVLPADSTIKTEEQAVFDQINAYRKQQGRKELTWSPQLKKSSAWMSKDMLSHNSLSHIDSRGRSIETRLKQCDYPFPAAVAENIDSGTSDPTSLMTAWRHSTKQNAILLNPGLTHVGIALAKSADGSKLYWTADFAGPAPTPTPTKIPSPTPKITAVPTSKVTPKVSIKPTTAPTGIQIPTRILTPNITQVPTLDPKFVANPLDTQIYVSVKYMGIGKGGNKTPKHNTRKVGVEIYNLENDVVKTGQGFIQYDNQNSFKGIIHLGEIKNEKYYVKIISDFNLTAVVLPQFQELNNERLNILPEVLIVQGDLDADNLISIEDYRIALSCFQDKKCVDINSIDFNDDGVANVVDYNILLQNYLRTQGD